MASYTPAELSYLLAGRDTASAGFAREALGLVELNEGDDGLAAGAQALVSNGRAHIENGQLQLSEEAMFIGSNDIIRAAREKYSEDLNTGYQHAPTSKNGFTELDPRLPAWNPAVHTGPVIGFPPRDAGDPAAHDHRNGGRRQRGRPALHERDRRPMRGRFAAACLSVITILATAGCTEGGIVGSERDYDWAIAQSNAHLADMQGHATDAEIDRVEIVNDDLDEDHHRKTCSDTTSQFTNAVNIWLTAGSDPVAIIDRVRDALVAEGWTRSPSVEELESGTQDPEGRYTQNLDSPERFLAQLSKWEDDGTSGISFSIISPCVANPSDKPDTWGR